MTPYGIIEELKRLLAECKNVPDNKIIAMSTNMKFGLFCLNHADEIIKAMEKGEKYERAYFRLEKRERDE